MDNVLAMIAKYGPNPESSSFASRHDAIAYHNIWADFWRYNIGVNVIPSDTKNKKPVVPWFGWQSKAIPESLHRQWKTEGLFSDGIAVILGKVWHRQDLANYYLVGVDADNKKAIDEICTYNEKSTTLQEFAAKTIVEHHRDNPNKAHFYFYATRPIKGKSSDNALLAHRLSANEIPAIEIKSLGSHGILYCSGSFHKDGYNYEIIGSRKPAILNELQTAELENHFNNIFNKYMISYLSTGRADNSASTKTKLPIEELFKPVYKVLEGHNRHEALLRVMESLILRNHNIFSLEEIKQLSKNWNNTHCKPPLDDRELEGQWKYALEFIASKQRQLSGQNDIGSQDHNQSITAEERQQEQNSHPVSELAEEIMSRYQFKTLSDTEETLYYRDGIYHSGGEQIIKTELEKLPVIRLKLISEMRL
jgi:hypothetical protein